MGSVDRLNHSNHQPSQPTSKMKTIFVLACLATVTLAQIQKAADSSAEACDCQCSSLTFRDTRGRVQGNCKTTYNGAQWSYQACATPGLDEFPCYNYRYGDDTPFVRTAGGSATAGAAGAAAAAAKPTNSEI